MFGRNGDSPVAIVAPQSPADCFDMAFEAVRIATRVHVPGLLPVGRLHRQRFRAVEDSRGRQAAEDRDQERDRAEQRGLDRPRPRERRGRERRASREAGKFLPYKRDEFLSRPWAIPGTPGLEHRIGGIEKQDVTGNINYEPANHQHMTDTRAKKIENIAETIPDLEVIGPADAELLVIGWGGTYGSITTAVAAGTAQGAEGRAGPLPLPEPDAEEHRRGAEAVQEDPGARN